MHICKLVTYVSDLKKFPVNIQNLFHFSILHLIKKKQYKLEEKALE